MMLSSLTRPLEPRALPHFLTMLSSTEVASNPGPHRHQIYEHLEEARSRRRSGGNEGLGSRQKLRKSIWLETSSEIDRSGVGRGNLLFFYVASP